MAKLISSSFLFLLGFLLCMFSFSSCEDSLSTGQNLELVTWCVANESIPDNKLKESVWIICAQLDCSEIELGGSCYEPNTWQNHASYALDLYYKTVGQCNSDVGTLTTKNPSYGSCKYSLSTGSEEQLVTWCVAKESIPDNKLKESVWITCAQLDCSEINLGGSCHEPNTWRNHASYALDLFYKTVGQCNSDVGNLTTNNPSYGSCKYP